MLQIRNGLSFHLHNHGNLRRQKNSSPSVSIPTTRNSIYLQHFRETRNWYRHELTIGSNGSRRSTHKRKLHCMVLDTRMHPFYSKQELPSKKSKLDWDTPVQNYFGYPRSCHAIQEAGSSPEICQLYWPVTGCPHFCPHFTFLIKFKIQQSLPYQGFSNLYHPYPTEPSIW